MRQPPMCVLGLSLHSTSPSARNRPMVQGAGAGRRTINHRYRCTLALHIDEIAHIRISARARPLARSRAAIAGRFSRPRCAARAAQFDPRTVTRSSGTNRMDLRAHSGIQNRSVHARTFRAHRIRRRGLCSLRGGFDIPVPSGGEGLIAVTTHIPAAAANIAAAAPAATATTSPAAKAAGFSAAADGGAASEGRSEGPALSLNCGPAGCGFEAGGKPDNGGGGGDRSGDGDDGGGAALPLHERSPEFGQDGVDGGTIDDRANGGDGGGTALLERVLTPVLREDGVDGEAIDDSAVGVPGGNDEDAAAAAAADGWNQTSLEYFSKDALETSAELESTNVGFPSPDEGGNTTSQIVSLCILGFGLSLLLKFVYSEYLAFLTMRRALCNSDKGKSNRRVPMEDFIKYRWESSTFLMNSAPSRRSQFPLLVAELIITSPQIRSPSR